MNRTLLEKTKAMLKTTDLAKSFWAEGVNTACYVINRSPSIAINLKTPMEMWTGKPVDYSCLHVFGSPTRLDLKSRKCIFLRYADGVKGYHLWDPTACKVVISRDVIFAEDKLQEMDDSTTKKDSKTIVIQLENNHEKEDSSKATPQNEAPVEPEIFEVRRSAGETRPPFWHSEYVVQKNVAYYLLTKDGEPSTFHEAIKSLDKSLWMTAMQEEIEALDKNKTWDLVSLPQGRKAIGNRWVYKIKRDANNQVERYRARLVVKDYAQKERIDFNEVFSPIVRLTTVRIVLVMCAIFDLHLEQLDVKTVFLHGELKEEIYIL